MKISEFQKSVQEFSDDKGWGKQSDDRRVSHLQTEVGEMVKEFIKTTDPERTDAEREKSKELLGLEMHDVFWNLADLANRMGINLEDAFKAKALSDSTRVWEGEKGGGLVSERMQAFDGPDRKIGEVVVSEAQFLLVTEVKNLLDLELATDDLTYMGHIKILTQYVGAVSDGLIPETFEAKSLARAVQVLRSKYSAPSWKEFDDIVITACMWLIQRNSMSLLNQKAKVCAGIKIKSKVL